MAKVESAPTNKRRRKNTDIVTDPAEPVETVESQSPNVKMEIDPDTTSITAEAIDHDFEQAKDFLLNPTQKRGRKPGSGAGEKRKSEGEYSTNPHAVKSRKRQVTGNPFRDEAQRARKAASQWVSRKMAKWKKGEEYAGIAVEDRPEREVEQKQKFMQQRKQEFEDRENNLLLQLLDRYQPQLAARLHCNQLEEFKRMIVQKIPDGDPRWWQDEIDQEDEHGITCVDSDKIAVRREQKYKQTGLGDEAIAIKRAKKSTVQRTLLNSRWKTWRVAMLDQFLTCWAKKHYLENVIGPMYWKIDDGNGNYRNVRLNSRWFRLADDRHKPHLYFDEDDKQILRFDWGQSNSEWLELPGPAEWWPDVTGQADDAEADRDALAYYESNGFYVAQYPSRAYRTILRVIRERQPPKGFDHCVLHEGPEIVWISQRAKKDPEPDVYDDLGEVDEDEALAGLADMRIAG
ncbi:hypothetical protein LTS08_003616 [Lithohypha guttulata]|uniref:Uncharacterized protein n=1 Tax=Lithohypha guttulata TaxID=1690604 RepID=A0AAN7SWB6_9EURO|nr:hypothetical protein LTR05_005926 [Lithohypha guttulata]KAK5102815.1 hypothetical protein LTS08_003616 [Lithohypha guttulata]